jgi:hypothetical protein
VVASETAIGGEGGGERAIGGVYLMIVSVYNILYYQWKMNTVQTTGAMTIAQKNQNI